MRTLSFIIALTAATACFAADPCDPTDQYTQPFKLCDITHGSLYFQNNAEITLNGILSINVIVSMQDAKGNKFSCSFVPKHNAGVSQSYFSCTSDENELYIENGTTYLFNYHQARAGLTLEFWRWVGYDCNGLGVRDLLLTAKVKLNPVLSTVRFRRPKDHGSRLGHVHGKRQTARLDDT